MRKAILIGFQYSGEKKLPGIVTDLFQVYTFLKKQGWSDDEIQILTDIERDETAKKLKRAVVEKLVDASILSFIEDLKERGQYVHFSLHNHYHNFSSVFKTNNLSSENDYLLVYYTGHAKNQHLILPQEAQLSFVQFQRLFKTALTLCLMDCCYGGLQLAFNLHNGVYRSHPNLPLTKSKIICIASTKTSQRAITGETGSAFTQALIFALNEIKEDRRLDKLVEKIKISKATQTTTISSSYPILNQIFGFVYSQPTISMIVYPKYLLIETH